jgi:FkbM family methyltransferase
MWPGLVKLDVEGAESHVLSGAAAWLGRREGMLLLEVHP